MLAHKRVHAIRAVVKRVVRTNLWEGGASSTDAPRRLGGHIVRSLEKRRDHVVRPAVQAVFQ